MRTFKILLPILMLVAMCGCVNPAPTIQALAGDTNAVSVDVVGWGVSVHMTRNLPYRVVSP